MDTISDEIFGAFAVDGNILSCTPVDSGLINRTYRVDTGSRSYLMQRINNNVFRDIDGLMKNVCGVTKYLHDRICENGGDGERETLTVIPTVGGEMYYKSTDGQYWRCYLFIDGTFICDDAADPSTLYNCALGFSRFQNLLSDYPVARLNETIHKFHDTPDRYGQFTAATENDICGRLASVRNEVGFVNERAVQLDYFVSRLNDGRLPTRITHNDTKMNNILFDNSTRKALCVIDLDTVMPGAVAYDFGDAIRSGAPTLNENTLTPKEVKLDLELFEAFTKGFLEGCAGCLTDNEVDSLVWGAKLMTLECGMRFLTDYLNGDVYFKTTRKNHNLTRAVSQFALVEDMENKWDKMNQIVNKYR